jgi:hypothetical protein
MGSGRWSSCADGVIEGIEWGKNPYELVSPQSVSRVRSDGVEKSSSEKVFPGDAVVDVEVHQGSSTDLSQLESGSESVTDPPFGGLLHYSSCPISSTYGFAWRSRTNTQQSLARVHPKVSGGSSQSGSRAGRSRWFLSAAAYPVLA